MVNSQWRKRIAASPGCTFTVELVTTLAGWPAFYQEPRAIKSKKGQRLLYACWDITGCWNGMNRIWYTEEGWYDSDYAEGDSTQSGNVWNCLMPSQTGVSSSLVLSALNWLLVCRISGKEKEASPASLTRSGIGTRVPNCCYSPKNCKTGSPS